METSKFKELINTFTEEGDLSVNLDFILKEEGNYSHHSTEPEEKLKENILSSFAKKMKSYYYLDDFELRDIYDDNASSSEITFYYDKIENNDLAHKLFSYSNEEREVYDYGNNQFSTLFGVIIELDNGEDKIRIFKKNYPVQVVKSKSLMNFFSTEGAEHLKLFDKDLFQLNDKPHVISFDSDVIIIAKKIYQDHFGFKQHLINKSEVALSHLNSIGYFEINETLFSRMGKFPQSTLKKLSNVVDENPILEGEDFSKLQQQAKDYAGHDIKIAESGLFNIKTKKDLTTLIEILNREYNKNEITGEVFKSTSKKLVKK